MRELPKQFKGKGQVKGYDFNQITADYTAIFTLKHLWRVV